MKALLKNEIIELNNYKNMSDEEIKEQLEWSDHHEFSYGYSTWAFERIKQLKKPSIIVDIKDDENIKELIEQLQSNWNSLKEWLKENEDKISYMEDVIDKMNELEGVDNENN